ncbi:putative ribonuclease H-like domain-containing protein [Tanacetum coccineum]
MFSNCHNTGHFARECKFKGSKEGSRQEAGRGQDFKPVRTEKEALMTIDEGQINWVEQTTDEELNHALMAFTVNNEANQIFEKDEKLKKYRRIGMKAVKDKDVLQKIVDSWFASSKNLWKLVDCGMSSTVKMGLGVLASNQDAEEIIKSHYTTIQTGVEYKGVPHPLSGDYTPREQEDIEESLIDDPISIPSKESGFHIHPKDSTTRSSPISTNKQLTPIVHSMAHLEDYQELNKVGSVTFGGSKGSISGKDNVKKLNVLFTEKECFVVSSDFKMPDEHQVLLKVPRQHNMYTFDMKNVVSSQAYTCILAKASSNEAKLWHRRLGHLNFKNLNKLVKDNLVRGLPSKSFKNDHTCIACQN